jgi:hypothetical protein
VNIQVNAQWVELRRLILTTLDASPHRQNKPWHGHRKRVAVVELREDLALATNREALTRRLGVEPAEWQQRILRSEADRVLLNCSRQSGKITMVAIIALHRALYHPGSLILCLAPALRQSQEFFGKIVGFYRHLGRPVPADAEQRLGLELTNGSWIVALPGTKKTIRGFSGVDLLVLHEATQVDDALSTPSGPCWPSAAVS